VTDVFPYVAEIGLTGWHGITWTPVRVVGRSKKKLRIMTLTDEPVKLAGRHRWLEPGKTATVPPHALRNPKSLIAEGER
jgi:hypothetical protein